jgi:hypothetical protein
VRTFPVRPASIRDLGVRLWNRRHA